MGIISGALRRGIGEAAGFGAEVAMTSAKSSIEEARQTRLAELQNQYQSQRDATQRGHDVNMVDVREQSRRAGALHDATEVDPIRNRNAVALAKDTTQARIDVETSPENIQKAITKLNAMAPAEAKIRRDAMLADLEAKSTPEALRAARLIAQATHIESASSVAQAELARMSIEEKQQVQAVRANYLAETDPAKKEAYADQLYTMLGKDRFTALMGKDEQGNPVFMGGFNTRTGEKTGGTKAPAAGRPPIYQFFGGSAPPPSKAPGIVNERITPPAAQAAPAPARPAYERFIENRRGGSYINAPRNSPAAGLNGKSYATRAEAIAALEELYGKL